MNDDISSCSILEATSHGHGAPSPLQLLSREINENASPLRHLSFLGKRSHDRFVSALVEVFHFMVCAAKNDDGRVMSETRQFGFGV